jgi:hypothetical protein
MTSSQSPYEPCPCGSGKKFKFCCRDTWADQDDRDAERTTREDLAAGQRNLERYNAELRARGVAVM